MMPRRVLRWYARLAGIDRSEPYRGIKWMLILHSVVAASAVLWVVVIVATFAAAIGECP